MTTFHERLRELRKKKNLTMREMARKVGVPETTYREWEVGRAIQGEPYVRIAKALEVSLSELLTGETPNHHHIVSEIERLQNDLQSLKQKVNHMI